MHFYIIYLNFMLDGHAWTGN